MGKYRVWDLPTRAFHWALVLCLLTSWATAEAGYDYMQWHLYSGYTVLALLLYRLLWGFFGTHYARFTTFLKGPRSVFASARSLFSPHPHNDPGHSAVSGWAVVMLLSLVAVQAGTGLFVSDDIFWMGPYNAVVSNDTAGTLAYIHHINFQALQAMVVLHLVVIAWYRLRKRENLVAPMVTGDKELDTPPANLGKHALKACVLAVLAALTVTGAVYFAPEPVYAGF